jgi:2-C-methyl-D-erythritol 4-phosphate cytidylyltransferase
VKKYVIIVAGGSGQRMLSDIPKQFLKLTGKPVLLYSLEAFAKAIPDITIILVLPDEHIKTWQMIITDIKISIQHIIIAGGKTRSQSVKNGLQPISEPGMVAIHDGVRPLITSSLIKKLFEEAERFGSSIPVIPVTDTVRKIEGESSMLIDRNYLRLAQTPQIFQSELLQKVYKNSDSGSFTDDAAVIESTGYKVHLCEGDPENIKITKPMDLQLAEAILRQRNSI